MMFSLKSVNSLRKALIVRRLRNSCYQCLTNYRQPIGLFEQVDWYFRDYLKASRLEQYRLYLFYNQDKVPVGYGALKLQDNQLYVTECIGEGYRGQDYGKDILFALVEIGRRENRDLIAEIWANNQPSIMLHQRAGFKLLGRRDQAGQELSIYCLQV